VITRRALLAGLAAGGGLLGLGLLGGYLLRDGMRLGGSSGGGMMGGGMMSGGMMGSATSVDMNMYMKLFDRHTELRRTVNEIPGGVRTTTESDTAELTALLQAHVSSMYGHVNQQAEVTCMSNSLPTLFRNATRYRRQLSLTTKGVSVTETSDDPQLTAAIRHHAAEVSGFVRDGMPAMMRGMMGG
jgi:hypothetical protein